MPPPTTPTRSSRPGSLRARLTDRLRPLTAVVGRFWEWATEPHRSVTDFDTRRRARAVASLMLLGVVFLILTNIPTPFYAREALAIQYYGMVSFWLGVVMLLMFALAKFGRLQASIFLGVILFTAVVLFAASRYGANIGGRYLYYITLITLFAMLFVRGRTLLALVAVQVSAMIFAPLYVDNLTFEQVAIGPLNFFIIVTMLNAIVIRHRDSLEERRTFQLKRSEARYRQLLDDISDIVTVTSLEGRILSLNHSGRVFYGGEAALAVGAKIDEMLAREEHSVSGYSYVHPEDADAAQGVMDELMKRGETDVHQLRMRRHDGVYRWMEVRAVLNRVPDEAPTITTVSRDITERKLNEDATRIREERFLFITEMLADYTYAFEIDQRAGTMHHEMIAGSKKATIGWEDDELPDLTRGYPPEYRQQAFDVWYEVLQGKPMRIESPVLRKDGSQVWMALYYFPVRSDHILRVYVVARNIQERKDREREQLAKALETERLVMAGNIVRAISHDFRTWLATIETSRYLVERISRDKGVFDLTEAKLDTIRRAVSHLTEQIDNLHMVTVLTQRPDTPCSVRRVLAVLHRDYQAMAQDKGQHFSLHLPDAGPLQDEHILGDEAELTRAFRQMIVNAITHTPKGGRIDVTLATSGEQVAVSIRDSGTGIAPAHLPYIFDMFYRPDRARSTENGGIGVGLSIARTIIETFGGTIAVESTLGQGSTFTVRLPRVIAHDAGQHRAAATVPTYGGV